MTRRNRRRLIALIAAIVMSLGTAGSALAAWSSLVNGSGAATAGTMPAGPDVTSAVLNNSDVTVSWGAKTLDGGATPSYLISRYAGTANSTPNTGCDTATTELQCTEANTPEGRWTYAVTVTKGSWTGVEGAKSAEVHVPTFAPTDLAATGTPTRTSVSLSWTDNSQIEEGYRLQRQDGDEWVNVGDLLSAGASSGQDDTITCGVTRTYRVIAVNTANGNSAPSTTAEATAAACPQAQAQPTGLSALAVSSTEINLAWTDNATGETGYRVEWSADNANWTAFSPELTPGANSYADTTLTCGVTRYYRVKALGEVDSNYSNTASATTTACAGPPAAPSNFAGEGVSPTTISLTWLDNSTNETGFVIQRSNNSQFNAGGNVQTFNIAANATSYQDTTAAATCGTTRYYKLHAVNGSGDSSVVTTTASTLECPPAAPSISVTANVHTLTVSWGAVTGATSYKVERYNTATSSWEQIATTSTTSYADALSCGQTRSYRVRATNAGGDSGYSNEASGSTQVCAPTGAPTLTVTASGYTANLSWTAVTGATGYRVERENGSNWDLVSTTANTTYNENIPCTQSRTYRVRAYNAGGEGSNSNTDSATSAACPKATKVELANTGTAGSVTTGDTVTVTYDQAIASSSFCSTWSGTGNQSLTDGNDVTVTITDDNNNDVLTVSSGSCTFKFGTVALGGNYVSATSTFAANGTNTKSTIVWTDSAKTLQIKIGNKASGPTVLTGVPSGTATYTPHADLRDTLGNPINTTPVSNSNQRL